MEAREANAMVRNHFVKQPVTSPGLAAVARVVRPLISKPELDTTSGVPGHASRDYRAHLAELGITPDEHAYPRALQAELQDARDMDPRVTSLDVKRFVTRSLMAENLRLFVRSPLLGFTRLVDAKCPLTPELLDSMKSAVLAEGVTEHDLHGLIQNGPADGRIAWKKPGNPAELYATLIRQTQLGSGDSLQIALSPELKGWLEAQLKNVPIGRAVGGAGAFCANLAAALNIPHVRFFSREGLPEGLKKMLHPAIGVVGPDGDVAKRMPGSKNEARINYALEYDGRSVGTSSGRIICSTKESFAPELGEVSRPALKKLAREHDLFFIVGPHYFTAETREVCLQKSRRLADQLRTMKSFNPKLWTHFQYVVPKDEKNEAAMLSQLRSSVDSMSLNACELPELIGRLAAAGMAQPSVDPRMNAARAESAEAMLAGAAELKAALGLKRVHIHGRNGDLIIDEGKGRRRGVLAAMRGRQLAVQKAAIQTGELKSPHEVERLVPLPSAKSLAAIYEFSDALSGRLGLSPKQTSKLHRRWWHRDEAGDTYSFVPARALYTREGGTISLGDTIDFTTLVFSRPRRNG